MTDYTNLSPSERWERLDQMATELFSGTTWRTAFCKKYGVANQTLSSWAKKGPQDWALPAVEDALKAKALDAIKAALA